MLAVDGIRLECRWFGEPAPGAPVLALLHEGLGSVSQWRDFPDRLAAATGLACFAYSRQGYGCSDAVALPRPLTYLHDEAGRLPRVLAAAGIARAVLVGHSDGATIALIHAVQNAADTAAVVAMAPHSFVEDAVFTGIRAAGEAFLAGPLRDGLARHHGDNVDCAFWGWNRAWLDPDFRLDIRADLARIRAPVLVIQGEDDEYATAEQLGIVAHTVPGAQALLLPGCRHAPHRDRPEATLAAIAGLVRGL